MDTDKLIRDLRAELDVLRGKGQTPQTGCRIEAMCLGDSEALVEYEYSPGDPGQYSGPPERCYPATDAEVVIIQVFVNGCWVDADLFAESTLEGWTQQLLESCAERECEDTDADEWRDRRRDWALEDAA